CAGSTFGASRAAPFDVPASGDVAVLDQVNGRVERWHAGRHAADTTVDVSGGIADRALEAAATLDVLERTDEASRTPELRSFAPSGALRSETPISDRTW